MRRFREIVGKDRPNEGDLIYIPMTKNFFEIIYVNDNSPFFTLGSNYLFQMMCQAWNYSHEEFATSEEVLNDFSKKKEESPSLDDNIEFNSFGDTVISGKNIFGLRLK